MKSGSPKSRGWIESIGLSLILSLLVGLLSSIPLVREWQARLADTFFRLVPPPKPRSKVVVVSIDDQSLQQYGRWPWSRELLARLTTSLAQAGAGPIGLDILLSEPQSPAADRALASAFDAAQRVVIVDKIGSLPEGPHWIEPLPAFVHSTALGHAHAVLDVDSICRRFPPRQLTLDGPRWAFAIEVARKADPQRTSTFLAAYGIPLSEDSLAVSIAKPVLVPIAFRRDGFDIIPASRILAGFDPALVRGRPVLVGFGPTEIGDRLSTPLSAELPVPGIEVHAQILDSILTGRMLHATPLWFAALVLLATGMAAVTAFHRSHSLALIGILVLAMSAAVYGICFAVFVLTSRFTPIGPMMLAVILAPSLVYTAEFVAVERSLTRQLRSLRSWLSLRAREIPVQEKGDLSWRLELLQSLQTELGSLYELHKALLESTQDLVAIFDSAGNLLLKNTPFSAALQLAPESRLKLEQLRGRWIASQDAPPVSNGNVEEGEVYVDDQLYSLRIAALPPTALSPRGGSIVTLTNLRTRVERDRARAEALGFITHELRTPLASIHGFANMLMHDPVSASAEGAAETIYRETNRLLALISSYLDVLRLDAGAKPLTIYIIDLESLVLQVFDILQPMAIAAGMKLISDIKQSVTLAADAPLITGAILNLVSNAIKYGQAGTDIRVSCSQHSHEVVIRVHNVGQPIAQEEIPRLFDPFYRAAKVETSKTGWGLGLAFVKRIAEKHGGSVAVSSQPTGTVFEIHLPAESELQVTSTAGGTT
jgi:signal transduction histidine kinase/CHASE2 domain-containing sensor protein